MSGRSTGTSKVSWGDAGNVQIVRTDDQKAVEIVLDAMANGRTVTVDNHGRAS